MKMRKIRLFMAAIVCVVALLNCTYVYSQEAQRKAIIARVRGDAEVKYLDQKKWVPARIAMVLTEGDAIKTGFDSWVLLHLNGKGETAAVEISENAKLLLSELQWHEESETHTTLLDLASGELLIKAKKLQAPESKFEVKTPTAIVGVRGTKFAVKVEALEE